jgi:OOP family OmpA-OmpF porin
MKRIRCMPFMILAAAAAATARAAEPGLYLGLDLGRSELEMDDAGANAEDRATSISAILDYRLNDYFAFEASYVDLGEFTTTTPMVCIAQIGAPCNPIETRTSVRGAALSVLGRWPISTHVVLRARSGLFYRHAGYRVGMVGSGSASDDDTIVLVGIGMGLPVGERFGLVLEATRYFDAGVAARPGQSGIRFSSEGDATELSLGVRWQL